MIKYIISSLKCRKTSPRLVLKITINHFYLIKEEQQNYFSYTTKIKIHCFFSETELKKIKYFYCKEKKENLRTMQPT